MSSRTIEVSTQLAAAPDEIWAHTRRPDVLTYVSRGMISFTPIDPPTWPTVWAPGEHRAAMRVFGMPMGEQVIGIEYPPPVGTTRRMRDNGRGRGIPVWDHMIEVAPEGDGTRYTDRVRIEAGLRTLLVATFARRLYAHRQARWRRLVASGFDLRA